MFKVHILGTSSAIPAYDRRPTAQVVNFNDRFYLIDCGEGTQFQLKDYKIKLSRIDGIFVSHMHGDHILGLPGLLATMSIFERKTPLKIFGPSALKKMIDIVLELSDSYVRYEIEFVSTEDYEPGQVIFQTEKLRVSTIPMVHRTFCRGFHFQEINKRPKFDFYKAKALEIPNEYFHLIKQGNDVILPDGRKIVPSQVLDAPSPALSFAHCSDTIYHPEIVPFVKEVSLLYHETTFMNDLKDRAEETFHSTCHDAANIALQAGVKKLVIGHYSARYGDLFPLLKQTREVFAQTELAVEGKVFDLRKDAK